MDEKLLNYAYYNLHRNTKDDIFKTLFLDAVYIWLLVILGYRKIIPPKEWIIYLLFLVLISVFTLKSSLYWKHYLYNGINSFCNSIIFFWMSYKCITFTRDNNLLVLYIYIFVYLACVIITMFAVKYNIKKDAFSGKDIQQSSIGYLSGAFALILSPVIFSNMNENEFFSLISFASIFLGWCYVMGVAQLYKAWILWRISK